MTDRAILFSAPMVRALLNGTKTQTRRLLTPQPKIHENGSWSWDVRDRGCVGASGTHLVGFVASAVFHAPFAIGDRLWVRETWQGLSFGDYLPTKHYPCDLRYFATDTCADLDADVRGYPWRPSIFMPRWASRLTLTVTDVRVERLQAISEKDAIAEGLEKGHHGGFCPVYRGAPELDWRIYPDAAYRALWDHINGPGAWEANPWVVAVTFTVARHNIDAGGEA